MFTATLRRLGPRLVLPLLPALATLLVLVLVLVANDRIVQKDLSQRAQFRVTQVASIFADLVARVISRRVSELQLVGGQLPQGSGASPDDAADALARLRAQSPSWTWIGQLDASGQLLASAPASPAGQLPAALLSPAQRDAPVPQLLEPAALPALHSLNLHDVLGVLVVPLADASGTRRGFLVAALHRDYFDAMRERTVGSPLARRGLEVRLSAPGGALLLGPAPGAPDGFESRAALRPIDSTVQLDWVAVASQPRALALSAASDLKGNLLLWGGVAALLISGLGLWIGRQLTRPYQQVFDAVSRARPAGPGEQPAPGALLGAVAQALRQLAPAWNVDASTHALLDQMLQDAQRLQQVLDQLPSPVYLLDEQGQVRFWNQQAEAMFGWPAAQALGRPITELVPGPMHAHPVRAPADGRPLAFEAPTTNRQGQERWGEWRQLPLRSSEGRAQGQIVLVRDITERVRANQQTAQHQQELADLNHRLMQQEEETTRRLAQTLHDQLGQTLGAVRLAYDSLQPVWRNAALERHRERAQRLDRMIDQAVAEVRQALVELRPPLLKELGLAAALDNEVQMRRGEVAPTGLHLRVAPVATLTRWPADVEHAAFMIAREAVANAARHANAQQIRLSLDGHPGQLTLRIDDNGQGIPADSQPQRPGHLGLVGMRERALAIGARLDVIPAEPRGLSVALHWPAHALAPDTPTTGHPP